ncbi:MAG: TolC family protein [Planctomycetes bacterium]|nr:TolC family protein [Planctomycetota bacterium]
MNTLPATLILPVLALVAGGCAADLPAGPYGRPAAGWPPVADTADAPPEAPALAEDAGVDDLLLYAALHSPELEASFAQWKAALERIPQARALPDPRFTYRYYIESVETRVGPQRQAFELAQTFPWLGKLALREDIAAAEAQAARRRFEAARLALAYRVRDAYHELAYLDRAIGITGQNIELLGAVEAIARRRYAVGAASHPDVIRAQVEQGVLADRLATLQQLRGPVAARLNAAMNRPAGAPLPTPRPAARIEASFTDEQLLAWAAEANPRLEALDFEVAARRHGIDLARRDYYPDITLGVGTIDTGRADMDVSESGKDPVMAMVSVNLPLWHDRIGAGVREARWQHRAAVGRRAATANGLTVEVQRAAFDFADAGRKIGLYRDTLLPKAEQALLAAQRAYTTGAAAFQDYLDAQRTLLEFQLALDRATATRAQRLAELEMLTGRPLPVDVKQAATPEENATEQPQNPTGRLP